MRTFIAIELPAPLKQLVAARRQGLAHALDAASLGGTFRWTPAANLHLTLRFLGDTTGAQRAEIEASLAAIAAAARPFVLAIGAAGAFPNLRKPNILWLDFTGDLPQLLPLQARIEAAAREAGFAPETRAFTPHLTIARAQKSAGGSQLQRAGEALRAALATQAGCQAGGEAGARADDPAAPSPLFTVDAIHLIHSDLQPQGPRYTPLATFALG